MRVVLESFHIGSPGSGGVLAAYLRYLYNTFRGMVKLVCISKASFLPSVQVNDINMLHKQLFINNTVSRCKSPSILQD
jgi:hypothetical protein